MRKFMLCFAIHGSARRYFSIPSHQSPLIPRILNAGCVDGACAFDAVAKNASIIHAMNSFARMLMLPLLLLAMFVAMTRAQLAPKPASYTRQSDVIYERLYGSSLTFELFKPKANANGA